MARPDWPICSSAAVGLAAALLLPAAAADDHVQHVIARGLTFLQTEQHASGHFPLVRWSTSNAANSAMRQLSPFGTAHVAAALRVVPDAAARPLEANALDALADELGPEGACKFLSRSDPASAQLPADTEDTALCMGLLRTAGRTTPAAPDLLPYQDGTGRFVTWIFSGATPTDAEAVRYSGPPLFYERRMPNEVDCVVNANVLFGLASTGQPLPEQACEYVSAMVEQGGFPGCSHYYRSEPVWAYIVTRAAAAGAQCLAPHLGALRDRLSAAQQADGGWGNALETALAMVALLRFELVAPSPAIDRGIAWLLTRQEADGGWPAEPYFIENLSPDVVFGSRAVTTATALEAIARYEAANARRSP